MWSFVTLCAIDAERHLPVISFPEKTCTTERSNAAARKTLSWSGQVPGCDPAELPMKAGERCF